MLVTRSASSTQSSLSPCLVAFLQWRRRRDHAAGSLAPRVPDPRADRLDRAPRARPPTRLVRGHPAAPRDRAARPFPVLPLPLRNRLRAAVAAPATARRGVDACSDLDVRAPALPGRRRPEGRVSSSATSSLFLVHWSLLSVVVTFVSGGRDAASRASRRRMRLLAFAAAALTVAISASRFQRGTLGSRASSSAARVDRGLAFLFGSRRRRSSAASWRTRSSSSCRRRSAA